MIIYAVIARANDATVFTESQQELKGNAAQVTLSLLEHLRDHPELIQEGERKTIVHCNEIENDFFSHFAEACSAILNDSDGPDEYFFHLYLKDGVVYCCLGDDSDGREQTVNFAFLEHIQQEFTKIYKPRRIQSANAYSMDKNFKPTLRSATHYHNINAGTLAQNEHVQTLTSQVDSLKTVMGRHMNLLLERGETIDVLMNKSDAMLADASVFKKKAKRMRSRMQRKNICMMGIVAAVVVMFLYLMVHGICGTGLEHCRSNSSSSSSNGGNDGGYNGNDDGGGN